MSKIPTAEEWLDNHKELSEYDAESHDEGGYSGVNRQGLYRIMIEFAKLHVKAALETAYKNGKIDFTDESGTDTSTMYLTNETAIKINKESILSAYPENLIH